MREAASGERARKTVFCLTMGCSKNSVDSERITGVLRQAGYDIVPEAAGSDVCLINTCGFIRPAVEENIEGILDMVDLKSSGGTGRVVVAGCLVNRYGANALGKEIPDVDGWTANDDYGAILRAVSGDPARTALDCSRRFSLPGTPKHVRYLKLSEGCDRHCAYCAIPSIRGALRSGAVDEIVSEAVELAADGARELCLVAQDLTAYGRDMGVKDGLLKLLDALEPSLPGDVWLRLLYLQPDGVDKKLLERVASGRILPYLDIPVQHSSRKVLSLMGRPGSYEALLGKFRLAREINPDFALRTTCMVGFPGEGREDFDGLLRFLDEARLDRVGAFAFSPEEGTPAASMPGQVAPRTKRSRLDKLMELQEGISLSRQELFLGRTLDVMIDEPARDGIAEGRSFREAPEADGLIEIRGARDGLAPGDVIKAVVTEVMEHDMIALEASCNV
ncbi:MAG: 30S ribosomal protein S12 methylthiotransferase RimO [Synergistaceae bacterium]|nr:30S ribosomal protein S12 methylthiotransferase RimO [Synergistaceae bacterium]